MTPSNKPSLFLGLMSGTSMDGICATLVDFSEDKPALLAASDTPYPKLLTRKLQQMISPSWKGSLSEVLDADVSVGRAFASASLALIKSSGVAPENIVAIGHHGQTLWHQPESDTPSSMQIGDPNIIAELTGISVVADWRRRDIAAGGQGAPLAPAFHLHYFTGSRQSAVLNLGGIANLTVLDTQLGFDCGPANTLLDVWSQRCLNKQFDEDGLWARCGKVNSSLLETCLDDAYFKLPPPKSTGREYFNLDWIHEKIGGRKIAEKDVQASLCELTAVSISHSLEQHAASTQELILCGGGTHNIYLVERLQSVTPWLSVVSSSSYGIDPDKMEAIAFAWLAKQTIEGKPGNIPHATGASGERVLGCVYYGSDTKKG